MPNSELHFFQDNMPTFQVQKSLQMTTEINGARMLIANRESKIIFPNYNHKNSSPLKCIFTRGMKVGQRLYVPVIGMYGKTAISICEDAAMAQWPLFLNTHSIYITPHEVKFTSGLSNEWLPLLLFWLCLLMLSTQCAYITTTLSLNIVTTSHTGTI